MRRRCLISLLLVGLVLAALIGTTGCKSASYTIRLEVEQPGQARAMATRGVEIAETPYLTSYAVLTATVYDAYNHEVTTGQVSFATSTPEAIYIHTEPWVTDRIAYCNINNYMIRETTITATYTPLDGESAVRTVNILVAKTAILPKESGINFDTNEMAAGLGSMIFTDAILVDSENSIRKITMSFPYGFKTVSYDPTLYIGDLFASYTQYPADGECISGEYTMNDANAECLGVMFIVKTELGRYVKMLVTGGGYTSGPGLPEQHELYIDFQEF